MSAVDTQAAEAELIAQRTVALLERGEFELSTNFYLHVNEFLYEGLDCEGFTPGTIRTEAVTEPEEILNGKSVIFILPARCKPSLEIFFAAEQGMKPEHPLSLDDILKLADRMGFLWQVHPFAKGNTETLSAFVQLYLTSSGFPINPAFWQEHAEYLHGALVRAMYRNIGAGVPLHKSFLQNFLEAALNGADHELDCEELVCQQLFDQPKWYRNDFKARL